MENINIVSVKSCIEKNRRDLKYIFMPFYKGGQPLKAGKKWGMTLLAASSMRFRWNEENPVRKEVFEQILKEIKSGVCTGSCSSEKGVCDCKYSFVPLELIHSKIIYRIKSKNDTLNLQGDGMISDNDSLIPVVTVSDCVPLFLYDDEKKVFGIVHSGWKGTGIIGELIKTAVKDYGCNVENLMIAVGPHICENCYCVDEERRNYFEENFGHCTQKITDNDITVTSDGKRLEYSLSLTKANLEVIKNCGVPLSNVTVSDDCTCCTQFSDGTNVFGSYRRQAAFLSEDIDNDKRSRIMCVQAAFII